MLAVVTVVLTAGCSGASNTSDSAAPATEGIEIPEPSTSSIPAPPNAAADAVADLEVDDQIGNGREVTVTSVLLGRGPAIMVITDRNGNVLGTKKVSPRTQPVTVRLHQPVTVSQELLATLYLDDGDGAFDPQKDTPMVDEESEPVGEDFDYIVQ